MPPITENGVIQTHAEAFKGHPVPGAGSKAGVKYYTWQEVAQHNTEKSAWVYIGTKVYDITPWLDRHPGGKTVLLLAAGRDCTDLFDSYHPFTDKPRAMLDSWYIGEMATTEFPQYKPDTGFYRDLRQAVGDHFRKTKTNPKDPIPGLLRLLFIIAVFCASWWVVNTYNVTTSWTVKALAAAVFGAFQALPLLHTMHDCSHTSFGPSEQWWSFFGRLTMDWMCGACLTSWHNQHIIGHHVYTNVVGADPDLPLVLEGDIRRVSRLQKWASFYKFQHIYLFVLYGVLGIKFRIQDLTETLYKQTNGPLRVNLPAGEHQKQLISKSVWFVWRILVPLLYFRIPLGEYVVMFIIAEFMTGYFLAFNFQVSHVSPSVDFPEIKSDGFNDEWAMAQVKTTVDYAHGNTLATFLCGALNYQTVHHLFPCVSQYAYPTIAPIVRGVCEKWKVPYTHVPTFWEAFMMHWRHLKALGEEATVQLNESQRQLDAEAKKAA